MASHVTSKRQKYAAGRSFYITILVISILAAWRILVPASGTGRSVVNAELHQRGVLGNIHVLSTKGDDEVGLP